MPRDFAAVFAALQPVLGGCAGRLSVKTDSAAVYTLETKSPSPFPQHKGHPLFFGAVRTGKAYVSLHLTPLYMCETLQAQIPPELKQRMQGKSCFNFKTAPEKKLLAALRKLAKAGADDWARRGWL